MNKIITNNPLVYDKYQNVELIDGDFRDVLTAARDYIHTGHTLKTHPLPASIKMLYSPFRTLILDDSKDDGNSVLIMESAIEKFDITMGNKNTDYSNANDYKLIDFILTQNAIKEIANFESQRR